MAIQIQLERVDKYYNFQKESEKHALKSATLQIDDGEFTAIMGRSGAGKSTLLHIVAMIESYEGGVYRWNGADVRGFSDADKSRIRNREIGIVLQSYGLVEGDSVLENVMIPLHFAGIRSNKKKRELAIQALDCVGIAELASCKVNRISGGQRQRVAIARAIVNHPSLILLDEPTGALDAETAAEIMTLLREFHAGGMTVVLVTHDKAMASLCERRIEMIDGTIVSDRR